MGSVSNIKHILSISLVPIILVTIVCVLVNSQPNHNRASEPSNGSTIHRYVTWQGAEADRLLACWLIKRFVDPKAEFEFVPIGTEVDNDSSIAFDMPGGRWFRGARQSTSELIYHKIGIKKKSLDGMTAMVRQLEMAYWMVDPLSESGRFNERLTQILGNYSETQERLQGVFVYLDEIYSNEGHVP